jgi:hypothetical protein
VPDVGDLWQGLPFIQLPIWPPGLAIVGCDASTSAIRLALAASAVLPEQSANVGTCWRQSLMKDKRNQGVGKMETSRPKVFWHVVYLHPLAHHGVGVPEELRGVTRYPIARLDEVVFDDWAGHS